MRLGWIFMFLIALNGRAAVPCSQRPHMLEQPWIRVNFACLEEVINDQSLGALAFTALAVGDDGTLYAARPRTGEVIALTDSDGDDLPDAPETLVSGLSLPNALVFSPGDDALYIAGGTNLYRWRDGALVTLVDDLPTEGAFGTGGLTMHGERLYVGIGASCQFCESPDPDRGAVWSFALDGSDRRVEMRGLLQPSDLVFVADRLYVIDTVRGILIAQDGQEIPFAADSQPTGLAFYPHDTNILTLIQNRLLVVLSGSSHPVHLTGYQVMSVDPVSGAVESVMPTQPEPGTPQSDFTDEEMSLRGSGFFPQRPIDVTVSPEGWVYISITDGRILALRPQ